MQGVVLYGWLFTIPVAISAADDIQAIYWVCVCLDFATCNSILLLIFIPKVLASSKEDNTATPINRWSRPIEGRVGKDPEFEGVQNDRKSAGIAIVSFGKPELEREILKLKALVESLQTRIQELIGNNSTRNGAAAATVDEEERLPIANLGPVDVCAKPLKNSGWP